MPATPKDGGAGAADAVNDAYDLRSELRAQAQAIPDELREPFIREDGDGAPTVFLDGSDPAPTFSGIEDPDWEEKLKTALRAVEKVVAERDAVTQPDRKPAPG